MSEFTFRGYSTRSPREAEAMYKKKTGNNPTVIVARPGFKVTESHPLLVRWNNCCAGGLLVGHNITPADIVDGKHSTDLSASIVFEPTGGAADIQPHGEQVDRRKIHIKLDKVEKPTCPHCCGGIDDFTLLGFWYGWKIGKEPPYWQALRKFVFRRDGFTCQVCHRRFRTAELRAHHIDPKENGGSDSSHNLITLCGECHYDEHPIMPGDEYGEAA